MLIIINKKQNLWNSTHIIFFHFPVTSCVTYSNTCLSSTVSNLIVDFLIPSFILSPRFVLNISPAKATMKYFWFLVLEFTLFKFHNFSDAKSIAHWRHTRVVASFRSIYNESRNNRTSCRITGVRESHFHYWFFPHTSEFPTCGKVNNLWKQFMLDPRRISKTADHNNLHRFHEV
jgi:hypothetical protein